MLDFDACKKLEEAGFPQRFGWNVARFHRNGKSFPPFREGEMIERDKFIAVPTLEDLIRELDASLWSLFRIEGQWGANWDFQDPGDYDRSLLAPTPEQALANFFLSLRGGTSGTSTGPA